MPRFHRWFANMGTEKKHRGLGKRVAFPVDFSSNQAIDYHDYCYYYLDYIYIIYTHYCLLFMIIIVKVPTGPQVTMPCWGWWCLFQVFWALMPVCIACPAGYLFAEDKRPWIWSPKWMGCGTVESQNNCGMPSILTWNWSILDMNMRTPPKNGLHFSFLVAIQFHGINGDSTPKSSRRS